MEEEVKVKHTCRGPKMVGPQGETMGRLQCGEDLTPLLDALPADGKERILECPKCGNKFAAFKNP